MQSNEGKTLAKCRSQLRLAEIFYDGKVKPNWEKAK
jgi:hypothetical protein